MRRLGLAAVGLWLAVFCKVGLGLLFGAEDYVDRVDRFPRLVVSSDVASDYKNWSILPLAVGKAFGADSVRSFAALQVVVLVAGTAVVLGTVARHRPETATRALIGFFATMLPSWLLISGGSYDQMLAVLLLAATLAERPWAASMAGLLLGLTHAEAAMVAVLGLALLSAAGIGPRPRARVWTLAGIGAARVAMTAWFRAAGQTADRARFVSELGVRTPLGYLADTWPIVVWSAACGGWLIVAAAVRDARDARVPAAVLAALALNLGATAITVDQSRVIMLTTMPIVVALAAYGGASHRRPTTPCVHRNALAIGLLAPVTISWVGGIAVAGTPLHVGW
jgi:hypothetical protein